MLETLLYILSVILKVGILPVAILIYKKKIKFLNGVFLGALLFLASFGCTVYSANMMYGISIIDSTVNSVFNEFLKAMESTNAYSANETALLRQLVEAAKNAYFILIPSVLVCTYLVSSYAVIMASKGLFALCKRDVSVFWRFCDFKMPKTGLVFGIAAYLISEFSGGTKLSYAFLNFAVIIMFAVIVCGLSVVDFKFRKKVKSSVLRFLIYCVFLLIALATMGFGAGLLMVIGVWDAVFDLRRERVNPNNGGTDV